MARNELEVYLLNAKKSRASRKKLLSLILVFSLMISSCVSWGLKLTGVTLAGDAFCGLTEHSHSDACYEKVLVCKFAEYAADNNSTRITYDEKASYTAGISEAADNTYASEAYQSPDSSYDESLETVMHIHTEECYELRLVCELEEHVHTTACYSDPDADVESRGEWEESFADANITGICSNDIVEIAKTQIGYRESEKNFSVDEFDIRHGYTRYGDWYGNIYGDWAAMFVSFCLSYGGVPQTVAPYNAGVNAMFTEWSGLGLINTASEHTAVSGDIVFFDRNGSGSAGSVGIVVQADEESISVIEGDYDDRVTVTAYSVIDSGIMAFGSIAEISAKVDIEINNKRVANVISLIDELPSYDAIVAEYESLGADEQEKYYKEITLKVKTVYAYYEDLPEELRLKVTNYDKLAELEFLWGASALALENVSASISVTQVNKYKDAVTTLVYGGSIRSVLGGGMSYYYWDIIIVDVDSNGNYYVSQYITADGDKRDYTPSTSGGFILLLYNTSVNTSVGDGVETFDFKSASSGTVSFGTLATEEEKELDIIQGADTSKLIEVNLYDYGDNINDLYNSDSKYPGFQQDFGTKSIGTAIGKFNMNFGNNITSNLLAGLSGVTVADGEGINATANGANTAVSGAILTTLQDGYPALADGTSLSYLFSTNTYAEKINNSSINGLFLYNSETGEYTFDSRKNHAQYETNDTFTLYKQIITSNFIMYPFGNFLPFNDIVSQTTRVSTIEKAYFAKISSRAQTKHDNGEDNKYSSFTSSPTPYGSLATALTKFNTLMDTEYKEGGWNYLTAVEKYFTLNGLTFTPPPDNDTYFDDMYSIDYDNATDFYFGMDMHMTFIQPKNGLTGLDGKQEMIFYFTGDDDVWIYIDGKLVLDLTGIHRHVGGKIDFVRGTVSYYSLITETGDVTGEPDKVVTFAELFGANSVNSNGTFKNYSSHKLDFYYMERGAGSGVCRMNFNLPLIHKNSISVSKELTSDADIEALGNPDFTFQIFSENGTDLFIGENVEYSVYNSEGMKTGTATTGPNGVFKLKAGQRAVFQNIPEDAGKYFVRELLDEEYFGQYGTVEVDGTSITSNSYGNVTVGTETFKGIDSPVKDVSDGSTLFAFNNNVVTDKLGSLAITKKIEAYGAVSTADEFSFNVSLDGQLLAEGTEYTVISADGTKTFKTVEKAGVVILKHNETAEIANILAGSVFEVTEVDSTGYTVFYEGENVTDTNGKASGTVPMGAAAAVNVTNIEKGISLQIPVLKSLINPDSSVHIYNFLLKQVTDSSGETAVEGGTELEASVEVTNSAQALFTLPYKEADFEMGETKLYYKLTEISDISDLNTVYDDALYVIEVTVTRAENADITATVTAVWLDGEVISGNSISYTNEILRSLRIEKRLEGIVSSDTRFSFEITASVSGNPLSGSYPVVGFSGTDTLTFVNGKVTVQLCVGEALTVSGLPLSAEWSVKEIGAVGYLTKVSSNGTDWEVSDTASGTLSENAGVIFINIVGPELPQTGGFGDIIFTFGGVLLMALPLMYGFSRRRRRERRVM